MTVLIRELGTRRTFACLDAKNVAKSLQRRGRDRLQQEYLSTAEAADALGVTAGTLRTWIASGHLPEPGWRTIGRRRERAYDRTWVEQANVKLHSNAATSSLDQGGRLNSKPQIYLSYDQADREIAADLARELQVLGWGTVQSGDATPIRGEVTGDDASAGQERPPVSVALLPHTRDSLPDEVIQAISRARVGQGLFVPVHVGGSSREQMPDALRSFQGLELTDKTFMPAIAAEIGRATAKFLLQRSDARAWEMPQLTGRVVKTRSTAAVRSLIVRSLKSQTGICWIIGPAGSGKSVAVSHALSSLKRQTDVAWIHPWSREDLPEILDQIRANAVSEFSGIRDGNRSVDGFRPIVVFDDYDDRPILDTLVEQTQTWAAVVVLSRASPGRMHPDDLVYEMQSLSLVEAVRFIDMSSSAPNDVEFMDAMRLLESTDPVLPLQVAATVRYVRERHPADAPSIEEADRSRRATINLLGQAETLRRLLWCLSPISVPQEAFSDKTILKALGVSKRTLSGVIADLADTHEVLMTSDGRLSVGRGREAGVLEPSDVRTVELAAAIVARASGEPWGGLIETRELVEFGDLISHLLRAKRFQLPLLTAILKLTIRIADLLTARKERTASRKLLLVVEEHAVFDGSDSHELQVAALTRAARLEIIAENWREASALAAAALQIAEHISTQDDVDSLGMRSLLVDTLIRGGDLQAADSTLAQTVDIARERFGPEAAVVLSLQARRARLLIELKRDADAEHVLRVATSAAGDGALAATSVVVTMRSDLATLLIRRGQWGEGVVLLEASLDLAKGALGSDDAVTQQLQLNLEEVLRGRERAARA